jgi:hypothetical protein
VGDTKFDDPVIGALPKLVYGVGVTGSIKFVPTENNLNLTGIFGGGSDYGLIRFSTRLNVNYTKTTPKGARGNFEPAMAMKFLRDGTHSANVLLRMMNNGRTDSWNWFKYDFTHHQGEIWNPNPMINGKFSCTTSFVHAVGIKDVAEFSQDGY